MKKHRVLRALRFVLFLLLAAALFGFFTMHLWNRLMPTLFGLHAISFWQAVGLLILGRILFGRIGGGGPRHFAWRRRMMERWEQMTPEEREKFQQGLRAGCGPFRGMPKEPKT